MSRPIKLLALTPFFAPAWGFGGPVRLLYSLLREVASRGHKVTVYTTNALEKDRVIPDHHKSLDGVEVHYLKNLSHYLAWRHKIFLPLGLGRVLGTVVRDYDIVFLTGYRNYMNYKATGYALKAGVPYVVAPYGSLPLNFGPKRLVKSLFEVLGGRRVLSGAARLLVQSSHEAEVARKLGVAEERIAVIPLCVELEEFRRLPPRGTLRSQLQIGEEEKVALFLGRITRLKGVDFLIQAFSRLWDGGHPFRLLIVGRDDGYLSQAQRLVRSLGLEGRVIITGPLYGEERLRAYVDCDLFAYSPLIYEETSLAALECCAAGRPVVTTEQASIPWLEEYGAGVTVPRSQEQFCRAVSSVLSDDQRREGMGRQARLMVEERFSLGSVATQLLSLLEELRENPVPQRERGAGV